MHFFRQAYLFFFKKKIKERPQHRGGLWLMHKSEDVRGDNGVLERGYGVFQEARLSGMIAASRGMKFRRLDE